VGTTSEKLVVLKGPERGQSGGVSKNNSPRADQRKRTTSTRNSPYLLFTPSKSIGKVLELGDGLAFLSGGRARKNVLDHDFLRSQREKKKTKKARKLIITPARLELSATGNEPGKEKKRAETGGG